MERSLDRGPLAGVRVLDLTDEKASFCSKVLADLGAFVIKIESPQGDSSRKIGPFWNNSAHSENSLFFWYHNTNKFGVTLDLEQSADRKVFLRQVEHTDVLVETYPPGYLACLDLGFDTLTKLNPRVIMVSVTGFGQSGPRRDFKSCDLVASALGGQMYVCGSPLLEPIKAYGEQSYFTASLHAAVGVLLALRRRAKTGKGDHVDISLQEAVASTLDFVLVRYFHDGAIAKRRGDRHWNDLFCILPCKDGFIHMTPLLGWETLIELLDSEGMVEDLKDKRWKDEEYRKTHVAHVVKVLQGWSRSHGVDELFELGQLMRFPWAPVCSPRNVVRSLQLQARGFFSDFDHPEPGRVLQYPGVPYRFSDHYSVPRRRAPLLGEHNLQIDQLVPELGQIEHGKTSVKERNRRDRLGREGILSGLRVLDFSRVLAGPYATRILADFGAEVIKVQSKKTATGAEDNSGPYFKAWNRNKRSVTLDMSHPEAREIALKLVSISDVVVENFSPRVMANWKLDYEKLIEVKPNLIMLSMSGMGQSGPWKDSVAFGPTVQSLGGLTYLTSYSEASPVGVGYAYADVIAGLYGAVAILAALERRDRTGSGQYIDLSEYEAVCTTIGPDLLDSSANLCQILPTGNRSSHIPASPYGCYRCTGKDRWCVIAVFDEMEWHALCRISGHPEWAADERFSNLEMRKHHAEELDILVEGWTSGTEAEEVMQLLQSAGVPAGVVQNAEDLAKDPQLRANEFFVDLTHPTGGRTVADRSPIRMPGVFTYAWKPAPLLGGDNEYVYLGLLGLSEAEYQACIKKGIIR
jgi:crotonobetainyl-CoA:carnitine CoA-transferase CaiB-like acyl-CoA transferase